MAVAVDSVVAADGVEREELVVVVSDGGGGVIVVHDVKHALEWVDALGRAHSHLSHAAAVSDRWSVATESKPLRLPLPLLPNPKPVGINQRLYLVVEQC